MQGWKAVVGGCPCETSSFTIATEQRYFLIELGQGIAKFKAEFLIDFSPKKSVPISISAA